MLKLISLFTIVSVIGMAPNFFPFQNDVDSKQDVEISSTLQIANPHTQTPHRVIPQHTKIANNIENEAHLKGKVFEFIDANPSVFNFKSTNVKVSGIRKVRKIWYANLVQIHNKTEVLNSEIIFRIHENGNLMAYGIDFYHDVQVSDFTPISSTTLQQKLVSSFESKTEHPLTVNQQHKFILPVWDKDHFEFFPVVEASVFDGHAFSQLVYAHAVTGEVLESIDKTHYDVQGNVKGQILPELSTDPQVNENLNLMHVTINGETVMTDENGNFNYNIVGGGSANLTAQLKGPFVNVVHFTGNDALIQQTVNQNDVVNLQFDDSNSNISERNVFYHINLMHQFNKLIDPNFTQLDYPLTCNVEDNITNTQTCNAYWNGTHLFFNVQGAGCQMNSAHGASVIYHEYGHAINDRLYNQMGDSNGLNNPTLHEAFADIASCLLLNESRFALGWFGPNTFTRNLSNANVYPGSVVGQQHTDGLILGGAFWDLGQLIGTQQAYSLAHFARYGTPDDSDLGLAYAEVYLETLIADDDDGNLLNGTPNSTAIDQAFCQHGIGSNLFSIRSIEHEEFENTNNYQDDYRIEAKLVAPSFISQSLQNAGLIYSTNNFVNAQGVAMQGVNDSMYEAFIPAQLPGTVVKYYFSMPNGNCGSGLQHPSRDFQHHYYSFRVGDYITSFSDDFDLDQGWTIGTPSDNATSGIWQRTNPQQVIDGVGFLLQPEDDHSVIGSQCFVTGGARGAQWFSNDVDGGKTTFTSPIFTDLDQSSVIEFYKWFAHGAAFVFPAQGTWKVQVSNNGTNWMDMENTQFGEQRKWIKVMYKLSDYVSITNQMQVRFIADDSGTGSIVEGLMDDFAIYSIDPSVGYDHQLINPLFSIYPNPTTNQLNLHFTEKTNFDYRFQFIDLSGKVIFSQNINAQQHALDLKPFNLTPGMYFVKIMTDNQSFVQKLLIK